MIFRQEPEKGIRAWRDHPFYAITRNVMRRVFVPHPRTGKPQYDKRGRLVTVMKRVPRVQAVHVSFKWSMEQAR
ncbi:MAG: hypothetical protein AB7F22_07735 [Reyranella sp.]|uniref:hypothetical protein n=1 Tax=Reyranella sp. TaxID=1929291 RepID=UPI003D0B0750